MPFRRKKNKTYKLSKNKENTKDILVLASNKLRIEDKKIATKVKSCENGYVTKETKERNNKITLKSEILQKNIANYNVTENMYSKCLDSIPKITISLCGDNTGRKSLENDNYTDEDSIFSYCLDSSSEDDSDSDYDQFGDFKCTCSADVTTDEEVGDDIESAA